MGIALYFIMAVGFGMVGCISVTSNNTTLNKVTTVLHYGGLIMTGAIGWMKFNVWVMLGGIATVFLVGMLLAYSIMRNTK